MPTDSNTDYEKMGQSYVPIVMSVALYTLEREVSPFKPTLGKFVGTIVIIIIIANAMARILFMLSCFA